MYFESEKMKTQEERLLCFLNLNFFAHDDK